LNSDDSLKIYKSTRVIINQQENNNKNNNISNSSYQTPLTRNFNNQEKKQNVHNVLKCEKFTLKKSDENFFNEKIHAFRTPVIKNKIENLDIENQTTEQLMLAQKLAIKQGAYFKIIYRNHFIY
jgi:hypothetical protein